MFLVGGGGPTLERLSGRATPGSTQPSLLRATVAPQSSSVELRNPPVKLVQLHHVLSATLV